MDYQGILVHDYDVTFYNYGADYQECFAHVLRYLKDSIDNKPDQEKISGFEKNIRLCWKQEQAVNSNTDTDEINMQRYFLLYNKKVLVYNANYKKGQRRKRIRWIR